VECISEQTYNKFVTFTIADIKIMKKKLYNLTVVIEQDEDGRFLAICPGLQGCYTEGGTVKEALELIKDAMKMHIEDRLENNEPIYKEVKTQKLNIAV
jgi:predicted RNase H-like HicB family nuclease